MRAPTLLAVSAIVLVLGTVVALGFAGGLGSGGLEATWTSDTGRDISSNHHAVAVGGERVYAPVSGADRTGNCALVAMNATDGSTAWAYTLPAANCTIHSVADPTVADLDGDGRLEVLAVTTEREVAVFDAESGDLRTRLGLSNYGYTKPLVADLAPSPGREIVAVDVSGTAFVFAADGTELWRADLDGYVWAQPAVADFDGDGDPELLVGERTGEAVLFAGDGSVEWNETVTTNGSVTWGAHGQADDDPALEAVFTTVGGDAVAVDGASGEVEWRTNVGEFAAVHELGDGDGDGDIETYVTTKDGTVRALDAATGAEEWSTEIVVDQVQMMPPPTLGDLDGDGAPELLATGNDGSVTVLDPANGDVLSTDGRDVPIFTHATLADVDDDGAQEAFVIYADGRVVRWEYEGGS
ncbi:PQQ-like beta-propeller repeat protein [Halogeometricum sp. S1BR25-6]|uniref:PQQ-like beta-propeller repeat protein n=1 Tax=Halogeometricum salsisoli TaxID=2950536 RepID=A0ABU2GIG2_9EURY|nr:PQQ-binding-like beta-propeller repeat protein [Halogeometricum sp. S1BR25-6]MDS0300201.1 PQQ-like beta-propeller repeat protein [Halogeometricum sp. S1BR25-6]